MKVIAVANQKGGVGKTTTVLNVGSGLVALGKRVLLVDLDPQAHLTISMGVSPDNSDNSSYQIFAQGNRKPGLGEGEPSLIPSSLALSSAEITLYSEPGRDYILKRFLSGIEGFDYCLLDCPPNLGVLTVNAFTAANYLLVPVQTEYLATRGFAALLSTLQIVRERLNPGLNILGVLATMYDGRKILDREVVERIQESFGGELFKTRIRNNVSLAEAPSHGKDIFAYKPESAGAADYKALCIEILERTGGKGA